MPADAATSPPSSAEAALASREAAEAYLASHPDQTFVLELRAAWHLDGKFKFRPPSPLRKVRAAEGHARALLRAVGERTNLGRALVAFLRQVERRDPATVEYRRRLATDPVDAKFALILANHAFTLWTRGPHDQRVSGRLAAVLAKAEGVKKPAARAKKKQGDDPVGLELRAWEAAMSRASKLVARWRADEL